MKQYKTRMTFHVKIFYNIYYLTKHNTCFIGREHSLLRARGLRFLEAKNAFDLGVTNEFSKKILNALFLVKRAVGWKKDE